MRKHRLIPILLLTVACGSHKGPQSDTQHAISTGPVDSPAIYRQRIGIGVTTASRTCIAIPNNNLVASSPVTLISPVLPQAFVQGEISAIVHDQCPVSKDIDPAVTSYDVRMKQGPLPKLTPLIAVTGTSSVFSMGANNYVQADLQQNNKFESFRACSGTDGVHLTVWQGNPLEGPLLWHGFYYAPGDTSVGPACAPKEMADPPTH